MGCQGRRGLRKRMKQPLSQHPLRPKRIRKNGNASSLFSTVKRACGLFVPARSAKRTHLLQFLILSAILWTAFSVTAWADFRFPQPDFDSGYVMPDTQKTMPRASGMEYVDTAVLFLALCLATFLVLKRRSRRGLFWLTIFSLGYFGFYREGCICPIGSIQNIALALFNPNYTVPISVLAFFVLPLVFALLFGRVYCSSVCPLGAIQDLVHLKPVKIPRALSTALGMIPYIYLGLSVLFAALSAGFLICRYDPFVGFFRLSGKMNMILFGTSLLVLGVFVGRPYCRFLCPYSVLLNWASRFSWKHMKITPDTCIQCRLCEDACPFDAIREPVPALTPPQREAGKKRLSVYLVLLPVLIFGGGLLGGLFHTPFSQMDRTVNLAEQIVLEDSGVITDTTLASEAFRASDSTKDELLASAGDIKQKYLTGGRITGCFIGLVFGLTLIRLSTQRTRTDYEPDRAACLSCGRCFLSCPREHLQRGLITPEELLAGPTALNPSPKPFRRKKT